MYRRALLPIFQEVSVHRMKLTNDRNIKEHVQLSGDSWRFNYRFFIKEILCKHEDFVYLLFAMKNMFVVWGMRSSEDYSKNEKWIDVLPQNLFDEIQHWNVPLAYIIIAENPRNKESFMIEFLESLVDKKYGLCNFLIEEMSKKFNFATGIPVDISKNRSFWGKYLRDAFDDEEDFWNFMKEQEIPTDYLIGYENCEFLSENQKRKKKQKY